MKFTLKDYQQGAVTDVLTRLRRARRNYRLDGEPSAFALSAATGSGKTVMAAAVIEALFNGDDLLGFDADPSAVVLWFSDDPSLNEQTRFRIMQASDRIPHSRLVVVDYPFDHRVLAPGHVYFINTQKFSRNSLLVRGFRDADRPEQPRLTPDLQTTSIWETIGNTIEDGERTLYMVLDEAHRGFGTRSGSAGKDRASIVSQLIRGQPGIPAMPIVWGISATVQRFNDAIASDTGRTKLPDVTVDPILIQASGLLKDDIILDIPAETGAFDLVLLARGARDTVAADAAWRAYAAEQGTPQDRVVPLLVVQVPNKPDETLLEEIVRTVRQEWPELPDDAVANVFGDHRTEPAGPYQIPYIEPQRVQESTHVRVLLAKDAVSTGWDCPRAEVMVSFRPARDETHITQLLGRMVRTPLARRIPGDDRLNSVACILPRFDRETAIRVARRLMNTGDPTGPEFETDTGGGAGRRVLIDPQDMAPNPHIPDEVWAAFEALPSQTLPRRQAKPIPRLTALAQALSQDGIVIGAGREAHSRLHATLDGIQAEHSDALAAKLEDVMRVDIERIRSRWAIRETTSTTYAEVADRRVIEEAVRATNRIITKDVAEGYATHLASPLSDDDEEAIDQLRAAQVTVSALGLLPELGETVDAAATKLANSWFTRYRVDIKGLTDARRTIYDEIRSQSRDPQPADLIRPKVRQEETKQPDGTPVEMRPRHLLSDAQGNYPTASLNGWERQVLDAELARPSTVAWYRNPSRSSQDSLAIAYRDGADGDSPWRALRPDFLFFTRLGDGTIRAGIVDPHGTHLADAIPKLRGLATFAEEHGDAFVRIDSIAEIDGTLRVLDLTEATVRKEVRAARDAAALFAGAAAAATDY